MPWRLFCVFLAVWSLGGYTEATFDQVGGFHESLKEYQSLHSHRKNSDITFDKEPVEPAAGSGGWILHDSDDEDLIESGSGSGSGMGELLPEGSLNKTTLMPTTTTMMTTTTPTTTTTTSRPLTPCEKQRQASRQLSGKYVPRCLPNGEFSSLQCRTHPWAGDCWCSDLEGAEIPGTAMQAPNVPSCDTGNNLPPCTHQLVQHVRSKLLGNFRPRCAADGQFDRVQCHGSICFCVDESTGSRVSGTEVHIPDTPNCDDDSADVNIPEVSTSSTPEVDVKDSNEGDINIDETIDEPKPTLPEAGTIDLDMEIGGSSDNQNEVEKTRTKFTEDNTSRKDTETEVYRAEQDNHQGDKVVRASEVITQPGILAGIIGGSVVLLLCVVLLVMFVVYRMRKKDEGSYPLDEPRKTPNYNYVRAPEKEFYA